MSIKEEIESRNKRKKLRLVYMSKLEEERNKLIDTLIRSRKEIERHNTRIDELILEEGSTIQRIRLNI